MSSVVVKSLDEAAVRRAVDEYAARLLQARPDIEEIVVFGSFATGTFAPGSDIDIFIILRDAQIPVRDRIPHLLPGPFPVGIDIFPYTRAEMDGLAPSTLLSAVRASRWRYRRTARSPQGLDPDPK